MSADLSRLLNALGLLALDTVLALAFVDQLWFRDLPCPLCILQRAGFFAAGVGIALNLVFGPKPSHYGVAIIGAIAGGIISMRQILLYIVPGTGSYGNPVFGLHLYTWAFITAVCHHSRLRHHAAGRPAVLQGRADVGPSEGAAAFGAAPVSCAGHRQRGLDRCAVRRRAVPGQPHKL